MWWRNRPQVYNTLYLQKTSLSGSSKRTPETSTYKQHQFSEWLESADSKANFFKKGEKKIETQKKMNITVQEQIVEQTNHP